MFSQACVCLQVGREWVCLVTGPGEGGMHGLRPIPGSGYAWSQVPSAGGHAWSQVPSGFGWVSPGIRYVQWGGYI